MHFRKLFNISLCLFLLSTVAKRLCIAVFITDVLKPKQAKVITVLYCLFTELGLAQRGHST